MSLVSLASSEERITQLQQQTERGTFIIASELRGRNWSLPAGVTGGDCG